MLTFRKDRDVESEMSSFEESQRRSTANALKDHMRKLSVVEQEGRDMVDETEEKVANAERRLSQVAEAIKSRVSHPL